MCPENETEFPVLELHELRDQEGFLKHCEIAEFLIKEFGWGDPAVNYHIGNAIRQATEKVTTIPGNDKKRRARLMSREAGKQMELGNFEGLEVDHAVPVSVINNKIQQGGIPNMESIVRNILSFTETVVITAEEHNVVLVAHGLNQRMPESWGPEAEDRLARYRKAGIAVVPNRYIELLSMHGN